MEMFTRLSDTGLTTWKTVRTTPTPSESNFAIDVEDGQRRAVDMNVDGNDHLSCTCYTRAPSWIEVLATYLSIYRRADNNYVMAHIPRDQI